MGEGLAVGEVHVIGSPVSVMRNSKNDCCSMYQFGSLKSKTSSIIPTVSMSLLDVVVVVEVVSVTEQPSVVEQVPWMEAVSEEQYVSGICRKMDCSASALRGS